MRGFFQEQQKAGRGHIAQWTGSSKYLSLAIANIAFLFVEGNGHKQSYSLAALFVF